jgi:hypothetical protein
VVVVGVVVVVVGVVVVGVVLGVVVGLVGVVRALSLPTVIVTVAPFRARCPPDGFCLSTTPTIVGSVVVADSVLGLKPARPSAAAACASLCPTTPGTVISLGACATTRLTLAPAVRDVPPLGDCESTVPADFSSETCWVTFPTVSPALVSAASADA